MSPTPIFSNFETFNEPSLVAALKAAQDFAADIRQQHISGRCLSILGTCGTGKTMLARCILTELGRNKWGILERVGPRATVQFRDCRRVSDTLRAGDYSVMEAMIDPLLLVLDDLGAEDDPLCKTAARFDRVLRQRAGRWTVVTSNLSLPMIAERLDTRIASWLIRGENKVIEVKTRDYGLRK